MQDFINTTILGVPDCGIEKHNGIICVYGLLLRNKEFFAGKAIVQLDIKKSRLVVGGE